MNQTDKENELDILNTIEWALETKRQKLTFGLDEKDAVYAREGRLFGVLLDCKDEITSLKAELEKARELIREILGIENKNKPVVEALKDVRGWEVKAKEFLRKEGTNE